MYSPPLQRPCFASPVPCGPALAEPLLVNIINTTNSSVACEMMGACMAGLVQHAPPPALTPAMIRAMGDWAHVMNTKGQLRGKELGDGCDTCKVRCWPSKLSCINVGRDDR